MKVWQVIVAGVVVHLILFYSIFDIYFTSPLVHGMTPVTARVPAPAKRLVLFVADGLRADKFFEPMENKAFRSPYLRSIIENVGAWGVSHTRVPTESRPGHVALIAGFYEDVSAVAKGWKENPVEFDSVFNKSRYTWSWGSPDILPMFAKDASGDHVTVMCYPAHFEDFAGSNMMELDVWVLKHFKKFLESATTNETLWRQLHEDRVVFFLHLLGIDTNGHSNKPHSEEYTQNIKYVDYLVKEVVTTLDEFYNHDAGTAYIMTSDHGMTNWGSHGAGDAHETLTPLVVWGAGIRGPKHTTHTCGDFNDSFCDEWHLNERARSDVSQADVAPLMSFLIGAAFPVNSVGVLPLDYLAGSVEDKAEAIYTNAAQILSQYQVKMQQVKERTISFFFRPFPELSTATNDLLKNVQEQINTDRHRDAIHESQFLIDIALRGLRYYQTYDRSFLGFSITSGFLGWIGYVLQLLVAEYTPAVLEFKQFRLLLDKKTSDQRVVRMFGVLAFLVTLLLAVQSLPWTNYLYCLVPVFLWMKIAQGWDLMYAAMKWAHDQTVLASVLTSVIVTLMGVEISVMCFFYRHLVSVGLVAIGLWAVTTPLWKTHKMTCWCWTGSCVAVAIFPLLPVVGSNSCTPLVLLAGVLTVVVGCFILTRLCKGAVPGHLDTVTKTVLAVQVVMAVLATLIVKITTDRIAEKSGSYFSTQLLSWLMFSVSPLLPLLTGVGLEVRLFSLALAFLVQYILLSITYEGLFLLFFMFLLYSWYRMESNLTHFTVEQGGSISSFRADIRSTCLRHSLARAHCHLYDDRTSVDKKDVKLVTRHLELADLRRAFFYIFFIVTGFFGTGNIASINSFDPASVYCFLTVFNPFIMGALMMTKVLLPFMVVTCMLRTVQMVTRAPLHGLMLLVSMLSSLMGLNFFFLVRDYGSWLEIGTSISHYVITMSITVFVSILIGLSQVLTSGSIPLSLMTKTD